MAKKSGDKKETKSDSKLDKSSVGYTLGIVSIVMAFFQPLAGIVFGIIGFAQSKKQSDGLSTRAKKLNKIGIILSAILFLLSLAIATYLNFKGLSFPGI